MPIRADHVGKNVPTARDERVEIRLTDGNVNHLSWDGRGMPEGRYRVRVVATDALDNPDGAGLEDARVSQTFLVDNGRPTVTGVTADRRDGGWRLEFAAMALGLGLYLIPLGMISSPGLIALEHAPVAALLATLKVGVAVTLVSYGVIAPGSALKRLSLVAAGLAILLYPLG